MEQLEGKNGVSGYILDFVAFSIEKRKGQKVAW